MRRVLMIVGVMGALAASAAWAGHPQKNLSKRVQGIAHQLEKATHHLYRAAEHDRHHYGAAEWRALNHLLGLKQEARHFHRQVERYARNPYHTEADYRRLVRVYYRAADRMRYLHARGRVLRDFYRVEALMSDLRATYRTASRYGPPVRGYGHYDSGHGHYGRPHTEPHGRARVYLPGVGVYWSW